MRNASREKSMIITFVCNSGRHNTLRWPKLSFQPLLKAHAAYGYIGNIWSSSTSLGAFPRIWKWSVKMYGLHLNVIWVLLKSAAVHLKTFFKITYCLWGANRLSFIASLTSSFVVHSQLWCNLSGIALENCLPHKTQGLFWSWEVLQLVEKQTLSKHSSFSVT